MAGRTELAGSTWRAVAEQWPRVVQTWRAVDDFLRQHPELPGAAQRTLEAGRARLAAAQQQRSPEGRVRATLATVRRLADECTAQAPDDAVLAEQVATWRRGADRIDQALTIVAGQRGLARRKMLARVVARTDALAGEAFDQLVADTGRRQPPPGTGPDVPTG